MLYFNINLDDPEEKKAYIKRIQESTGRMEIIHEHVGEGRTNAQNKRYRVMLTLLAEYTGHSEAWFHKRFKQHLVPHVKWNPLAKITTADMTSREFEKYCEWITEFYLELIADPSMLDQEMQYSPIIKSKHKSNEQF